MFEKYRSTIFYKLNGILGIIYVLIFVGAIIWAITASGWAFAQSIAVLMVATPVLIILTVILSILALCQSKFSKTLNAKPSILADVGYTIICLVSLYLLKSISTALMNETLRDMYYGHIVTQVEFKNVPNEIERALSNMSIDATYGYDKNAHCRVSKESFAQCLSKELKDVTSVDGNVINTKDRIYTVYYSSKCSYLDNAGCKIRVKNKNSKKKRYLELSYSNVKNSKNDIVYTLYGNYKIRNEKSKKSHIRKHI